jgi:hypothetical protein
MNRTYTCTFTNVQPTPQGQQAGVLASLINPNGQDLTDCGPVLFTILAG